MAFISVRGLCCFVFKVTKLIRAEQLVRMDVLILSLISERNTNLVTR